ncbi:hypothetical protein M422DRAFT_57069 [Sphaerobolus stellatus SS14]|uniref:Uncharacterized protein n=1 Tax=Sphaerobolus stellatus (strain SS14) TaxID=990650 RepID=A0A0C9T1W4_SPHS4|nr:hypothetical protein M422DRAFT_57069 [Sphaerobolus stellatus SS14]
MHLNSPFEPPSKTTPIVLFAGSLFCLWGLHLLLSYRKVLQSIHNHPGLRICFTPTGIIGNILPRIPGIAIGAHWGMRRKHEGLYAPFGWDIVSIIGFYPKIRADFFIADPYAAKVLSLLGNCASPFPVP